MPACYTGPDPYDNVPDRMGIWKWAKEHGGIDEGKDLEDVGKAINQYFYGGIGKPEWILDKINGNKTPIKPFVIDMWKKQYNRRQIIAQASELTNTIRHEQKLGPILSRLEKIVEAPRKIAVFRHGITFSLTHPGDLALVLQNLPLIARKLAATVQHAHPFASAKVAARSDVAVAQMLAAMKAGPLYDLALYVKLNVGEGKGSELGNLSSGKSGPNQRGWAILKTTRMEFFEKEMKLAMKRNPGMTEEEKLAYGKEISDLANHATGSGGNWLSKANWLLFGPKLTASKLDRMFGDPAKTLVTYSKMLSSKLGAKTNVTPAERYIAFRRTSRAVQYLGTLTGAMTLNYWVNKVFFGTDDKDNINWSDPSKSDYMAFKTGGLEWSVPGLHTELKFLATLMGIFAQATHTSKEIGKESRGYGQWGELGKTLGQYGLGKVIPGGQIGIELVAGHTFTGRPLPLPWIDQKGQPHAPAFSGIPGLYGVDEYILSHAPIPLTGPIKYVYDQMRLGGMSAHDTLSIIRGLIKAGVMTAGGVTGLHVSPDYGAAKAEAKKQQTAQKLVH